MFCFLLFHAWTSRGMFDTGTFDPYEILGIGTDATEEQIRKQYKVLSLKYHPDRMRNVDEVAQQEAQSTFIQISKAYAM